MKMKMKMKAVWYGTSVAILLAIGFFSFHQNDKGEVTQASLFQFSSNFLHDIKKFDPKLYFQNNRFFTGDTSTPDQNAQKIDAEFQAHRQEIADDINRAANNKLLELNQEKFFDGVWTNWYKKGMARGLIQLGLMRQLLDTNNLFDTYDNDNKTPDMPGVTCDKNDKAVTSYRSADGRCTDLDEPAMGMAGVRMGRNVPPPQAVPEKEPGLLEPNPRTVSRVLLTRNEFKAVPFLNLFVTAWIQFMVHDWFFHGDNKMMTDNPFRLALDQGDPMASQFTDGFMVIPRTLPDATRSQYPSPSGIPTYINYTTAWWDASQIYGSDQETQDRIRSHVDGKLTVSSDGTIPIDPHTGLEMTGFTRNWWVGLSVLHNLFVNEHNAICDKLKATHPYFDDEQLFQHARLINAAVIAKIHTVEWTPSVLNNKILGVGMNANWFGLVNQKHKSVDTKFKEILDVINAPGLGSLRPALTGLVGGERDLHGVPYSLTEEFTSVYRLHSLLPDRIDVHRPDKSLIRSVSLADTRMKKANHLLKGVGLENLVYTFGVTHPGALVLNNFPATLQALQIPKVPSMGNVDGGPVIDMAAVDILRDRERGVPRYNRFRQLIGLKPITKFEDLFDDLSNSEEATELANLKKVYNNDVNRLDLLPGTLAEHIRPDGYGFGETDFQIFILMASRRLQADRFFSKEYYTPAVYTQEGLDWIDGETMAGVIGRQYPELKAKMKSAKTAFNPWTE